MTLTILRVPCGMVLWGAWSHRTNPHHEVTLDMPASTPEYVRVLIIEDDPEEIMLLEHAFEDIGAPCALREASTLDGGMTALASAPADVILLDLTLPDSHGLATLDVMLAASDGTPIVVLTGWADEETAGQAVARGAQDYIVKGSTDGAGVWRAIRYAIQRARLLEGMEDRRRSEFEELLREEDDRAQETVVARREDSRPDEAIAAERELENQLVEAYRDVLLSYVNALRDGVSVPAHEVQRLARTLAAERLNASYVVHIHLRATTEGQVDTRPSFRREARLCLMGMLGDLADMYLDELVSSRALTS